MIYCTDTAFIKNKNFNNIQFYYIILYYISLTDNKFISTADSAAAPGGEYAASYRPKGYIGSEINPSCLNSSNTINMYMKIDITSDKCLLGRRDTSN